MSGDVTWVSKAGIHRHSLGIHMRTMGTRGTVGTMMELV